MEADVENGTIIIRPVIVSRFPKSKEKKRLGLWKAPGTPHEKSTVWVDGMAGIWLY